MKYLLISDTHLGNHQAFSKVEKDGVNSRLALQLNTIAEALEIGIKYGCESIIHLGDVFHKRGMVEPEAVNLFKRLLKLYKKNYKKMYLLSGNHDITVEGPTFNSANVLDGALGGLVDVVHSPTFFEGGKLLMFPFTSNNFEGKLNGFLEDIETKHTALFIHQNIKGLMWGSHKMEGINPQVFKKFKMVFNGHVHQPQTTNNNIVTVGAPYHMDFGDQGDRYCWTYDDVSGNIRKFPLKHPKFITLNEGESVPEDDYYNFYRVITDKKTSQRLPPNVKEHVKPNISFIPRISTTDPKELMQHYCKVMSFPNMLKRGEQILKASAGEN